MKKFLAVILALEMLVSMGTMVSAAYGEHEHQLMDMANMNCHYSECTICFELFNVGDHTFEDGKCTVCGHSQMVNPFVDVKESAWYYGEIMNAVDTGIINGKTTTEFKPDDFLTYAEAIKLAACMRQKYEDGEVTLKNGSPWYQSYVDFCKEKKIITKDFPYSDNATRAGYMEIFANALPDEAFTEIIQFQTEVFWMWMRVLRMLIMCTSSTVPALLQVLTVIITVIPKQTLREARLQ